MPFPTVKVKLPASKTYEVREAEFTRYTTEGFPVAGILVLREQVADGRKVYERRFAVKEVEYDRGRRFVLTKPLGSTKPEDDDRYTVLLAAHGPDGCHCRGHLKGGYCSHAEGVRRLAAAGAFPAHPGIPARPPVRLPGVSTADPAPQQAEPRGRAIGAARG